MTSTDVFALVQTVVMVAAVPWAIRVTWHISGMKARLEAVLSVELIEVKRRLTKVEEKLFG